jgi:hypothetical protein
MWESGNNIHDRGGPMKRKMRWIVCFWLGCMLLCLSEAPCLRAEQAVSLGYGLAAYNAERHTGRIEGGKHYDFAQVTYIFEQPFAANQLGLVVEPFAAYVNRPNPGVDFGFDVALRYYPVRTEKGSFYISIGAGSAYTTTGFKEQGTHMLGILQGGLGYKYKSFFVEDRFRHYSNGGTASPNWSVNANILIIGTSF